MNNGIPDAVRQPAMRWLNRQMLKLVTLMTATFGLTQEDAAQTFAFVVALLLWLFEIWQSRRAITGTKAAVLEEAAAVLRRMADGATQLAEQHVEAGADLSARNWQNYRTAYLAAAESLTGKSPD